MAHGRTNTTTFDSWLEQVDDRFTAKTGMSIHDVEDQPFHDWYADGMSPSAAASEAFQNLRDEL